ncbi:MAG: hypothetical protein WCF18_15990 [Chthoniobacteraceae bacterium]
MALFALVFFVVALVLIGVGVAVGLVGCVLAVMLLGLGVISSSAFIGLRSGRPGLGFRVFLLQCGLLAGIPAGAVCAWLAQSFFAAYGAGWPVLLYGALGGAFSGVLVALVIDFTARHLHVWASLRFHTSRSSRDGESDRRN